MKICSKCGLEKDENEFSWKIKSKNLLQSKCKNCHADYAKDYHDNNKPIRLTQIKRNNSKYRSQIRDYIWNYLKSNPCVDCGENNPIVLEFDHKSDKKFVISSAVKSNRNLKSVVAEINKCDIRCANCHRKKTAIDFGYWSDKMLT